MKFYKNILKVVALLLFGTIYAQQEPNYALYRYTMNAINPAYAAADGETSLTSSFRSQWVNVQDAPETQTFFFATPLTEKFGIGLSIINDKVFVENRTSFNVDFSYKLKFSETTDLFLGLKAGASTYNIDEDGFGRFGFNNGDSAIQNIDEGFRPNLGVGAHLFNEKYFVSFSINGLLQGERVNVDDGRVTTSNNNSHWYLSGGYNFDLSDKFEFRPSTMIRYVNGSPLSADFTAAFRYNKRFELAGVYTTDGAWAGTLMFNLADWMDFGYAYGGSSRSDLNDINDGTHEILVRFNFPKKNNSDE
ncbi:PorP/SprF family type IX secretion system membrane protein [Winogradskyella haliclonae]|uniref:Membrane protein n=1 Tax=Winogradskyella haliclonae TaxID=2048558 RepID=A0ABQ2BW14_9FLAO|nr:type IX secretion system membrane protein PorP/SprF [Winogradskyella haliclonae]GGI56030.1 membrane protein [Winogradskyella haliclonae]